MLIVSLYVKFKAQTTHIQWGAIMEENLRKIFANNLKKQLSLHNKNQSDLAKYMDVSTATVSEWCNGKKMPRTDKIRSICNWLFIEMNDLLCENDADDDVGDA